MHFMKVAAIAAATVVAQPALAQPGFSQDAPPPVAPVESYNDPLTGFRFEAAAGYDRIEANIYEDDTKYYDGTDGVRYGSEIGYDAAIGAGIVIGGYLSYNASTINRCDEIAFFVLCQKAGNEVAGGGRIGARMGSASQLYAKIGYSQMNSNLSVGSDDLRETYKGVQFGFGGELGIGRGAYLKGELVASRFGTKDTIYEDLNLDRRSVVVGLGYRF